MFKNYLLRKSKQSDWMIMVGYDFKTVNKSKLDEHLKSGWEFVEERYLYFSNLKEWFVKQELSIKLAIISLAVGSILTIIFGIFGK